VRVVVLHGWLHDRTTFHLLRPYLDGERFTYAFPDLRGYGEARAIGGDYTVLEVAQDAVALADHLGWERFCVVGHSMGGKAAQLVPVIAERRVQAIVGIAPCPASGVRFDAAQTQQFVRALDDRSARAAMLDFATSGRLPRLWLDAAVQRSLDCADRDAMAAYFPDWSGKDMHELVAGCEVPALAVVGEHDPGLEERAMRDTWMRWFKRGEVRSFADSGHYLMDEVPLALISVIEEFLTRAGQA
jgi:pimeloyl-ACP methyl ester carboxylesterase